jgi:hypothetical protein
MIVGRKGIAFMVVQAVAIRRHARHEDVTAYLAVENLRCVRNLRTSCTALPVISGVKYHVKPRRAHGFLNAGGVISISNQVVHSLTKRLPLFAMQKVYFVARLQQFAHQQLANEMRAADYQNPLLGWFFELWGVLFMTAGTIHWS